MCICAERAKCADDELKWSFHFDASGRFEFVRGKDRSQQRFDVAISTGKHSGNAVYQRRRDIFRDKPAYQLRRNMPCGGWMLANDFNKVVQIRGPASSRDRVP